VTDARTDLRTIVLVAVGGSAGTLARYGLGRWAVVAPGTFPTTTFAINVTGAFLLGLILGALGRYRAADTTWRPLVGVGFLGGYTTFSTFAVETTQLVRADRTVTAAMYVVASVVVGLIAARLGEAVIGLPPAAIPQDEM
jgi:CrcB protein